MAVRRILLLGEPGLYEKAVPIGPGEEGLVASVARDLRDTLMEFRSRFGAGRAIAAPQIGVGRRIVYMDTGRPVILVNPVLKDRSTEMMELWDDCMSFPGICVKVRRHRSCRVEYLDGGLGEASMDLEGGLSELLQHETDHLDGVLATMRAVGPRGFRIDRERWRLLRSGACGPGPARR